MDREVYSWRVSRDLKLELERQARARKTSVAAVLDTAVRDWLKQSGREENGRDEEQRRLHAAAEKSIGAIAGRDPRRSERVSQLIRDGLRRRHGR